MVEKLTKRASIFGNHKRTVSDRGAAFTSRLFKSYCEEEGIQHYIIATGVPRGNGQVERMNRVVVPMLAKLSQEHPEQWYRHGAKSNST